MKYTLELSEEELEVLLFTLSCEFSRVCMYADGFDFDDEEAIERFGDIMNLGKEIQMLLDAHKSKTDSEERTSYV